MAVSYVMKCSFILISFVYLSQHVSAIGDLVEEVSPVADGIQVAFSVALNRSVNFTDGGSLSLPQDVANADQSYRHDTDTFVSRTSGLYFLFICIGVQPRSTVTVQQVGGYPKMSYVWQSSNHADIRVGCRSGILRLTRQVTVGLTVQRGSRIFSGGRQTSLSVISVTDAMTSSSGALFVSSSLQGPYNTQGPIPFGCQKTIFVNPIPPEASFNAATNSYICLTGGYYLVSVSVGIDQGYTARVQLTDNDQINFELTHNTRESNGRIIVTRSVLLHCPAGTNLQVALVDGDISSGPVANRCDRNLVSWTALRYAPVNQTAAWAVYFDRVPNMPTGNDSKILNFTVVHINDGIGYQDGVVTVLYSGMYMVYLGAATSPGQPINLVVMRNNAVISSLVASVTAADGANMMEHGIIVPLVTGDILAVVAGDGSSFYSDMGWQVGFWGFLVSSD